MHNLRRKTRKHRPTRIRTNIQLLRRQTKMLNNLPQEPRIRSPRIRRLPAIEHGMLNSRGFVSQLV